MFLSNSTPTHKQVRTAQQILGAPYEGAGARASTTASSLRQTPWRRSARFHNSAARQQTPECFWVLVITGGKATGAAQGRQSTAALGAKTRARSAGFHNSSARQQRPKSDGAPERGLPRRAHAAGPGPLPLAKSQTTPTSATLAKNRRGFASTRKGDAFDCKNSTQQKV